MESINVTSAQYVAENSLKYGMQCTIDGQEMFVPLDPANRHYAAIKARHDDPNDSFTIQDAD